eukprot:TRINITY_DN2865_c0_g1_i3.p1 TRINITY_DN2865_c0_g1~~TRINITY_DN2865_c0_g1_i3.p1  ORF type:complete len:312 (-),score=60.10 TRINITY_DN2865_c0_g1_i3:28-837(-)
MDGKVIIITGASSGIGKQMAISISQNNKRIKLVIASRKKESLESVLKDCCNENGNQIVYCQFDSSIKQSCKELIEFTIDKFGRLDILMLNAGISLHLAFQSATEEDLELFRSLMDVNYFGYVYPTYYALPFLEKCGGQIGVVCSLSGELGLPYRTGYCASKFAVRGFFESLRTEISPKIGVTIVSPGTVSSNMRDNSLKPSSSTSHLNEEENSKMTVEEAAQSIIQAVVSKKENVVLTWSGKLGVSLKPFFPSLISKLAAKKASNQSKL